MLSRIEYLSVHETRPGDDIALVWHEHGDPVIREIASPLTILRKEAGPRKLEQALEKVLRRSEGFPGPLLLQFDPKSPSLAALDWEGLIYKSAAKSVSRVRRWSLPAFGRSPLGSVLILVADSVFDKETGNIVNELVATSRDHGELCALATATSEAARRAEEYWIEPRLEYFSVDPGVGNDLKSCLSGLRRSFDTLFVIADSWSSSGAPGLRIGDEKFARFVGAPEIVRTAARIGAARIVLITSPGRCAGVARMLAHRAADEAPIDVHLLVANVGSAADSVRAYLDSAFEDPGQIENYDPWMVLRYESPLISHRPLDIDPRGVDWVQFGIAFLREYTMAETLANDNIQRDHPWMMPVQRIFEKYAAAPFELLVETGSIRSFLPEAMGGSWGGVLQALKDMKSIFGGGDERAPLARSAR
jgi:hypothetical protein